VAAVASRQGPLWWAPASHEWERAQMRSLCSVSDESAQDERVPDVALWRHNAQGSTHNSPRHRNTHRHTPGARVRIRTQL